MTLRVAAWQIGMMHQDLRIAAVQRRRSTPILGPPGTFQVVEPGVRGPAPTALRVTVVDIAIGHSILRSLELTMLGWVLQVGRGSKSAVAFSAVLVGFFVLMLVLAVITWCRCTLVPASAIFALPPASVHMIAHPMDPGRPPRAAASVSRAALCLTALSQGGGRSVGACGHCSA